MNTLTDILSLIKRKQYIKQLKASDVLVVGVHEEPDMLGIASPVPYKSVRLVKVSDLNTFLDNKIDIREPLTCPVGPSVDTSVINIARETSDQYLNGLTHFNQKITLNGSASTAGSPIFRLGRHEYDSNFSANSPFVYRILNQEYVSIQRGGGTFFSISGVVNTVSLTGNNAKNVTVVYGSYNDIQISDTNLTDIQFSVGVASRTSVTNSQAIVDFLYSYYAAFNLTNPASTIDDVRGLYIDTDASDTAQINKYYGIYHSIGPANATTEYFIYSLYDAPSLFTGTISSKQFKLNALNPTVTTSTDPGTTGEIRIDANYIYICVAPNTWKRAQLSTW